MDEETYYRLLDLGTEFKLHLGWWAPHNHADFTVEQFIASLKATTTLTTLDVNFKNYEPTPENNRRFFEPLCRCIANLRRHNPIHPLRELAIWDADQGNNDVKQILVAAKQIKIQSFGFCNTRLPIRALVELCRDNR